MVHASLACILVNSSAVEPLAILEKKQ